MSWRPAKCLTVLKAQIDKAHPHRPKQSDGMVASSQHHQANPNSDHEPNEHGVVCAWDITTADFTDTLAEQLRALGKAGDPRVAYVIYKRRIASAKQGWAWRPYTKGDPHLNHIHLSVSQDPKVYDLTHPWNLNPAPKKAAAKKAPAKPAAKPKPPPFPLAEGHWFGVVSNDPHNHSGLNHPDAEAIVKIARKLGVKTTGRFTPEVERAVVTFQKAHHLQADGRCGPVTWRAMFG